MRKHLWLAIRPALRYPLSYWQGNVCKTHTLVVRVVVGLVFHVAVVLTIQPFRATLMADWKAIGKTQLMAISDVRVAEYRIRVGLGVIGVLSVKIIAAGRCPNSALCGGEAILSDWINAYALTGARARELCLGQYLV